MAETFQVPKTVIEAVVTQMKNSYLVHPEATFNRDADEGLRREVAYRDFDFLERIGEPGHEEIIVDAALAYLKERGLVPAAAGYDKTALAELRSAVAEEFTRSDWTSITPVMERMLFMLTSVKKPSVMIELGCFWGNTLAWFAGPCLGTKPGFVPQKVYGIDIDARAIEMARKNFSALVTPPGLEIICEDARHTLTKLDGPFDLVYIEASTPGVPDKGVLYLSLLQQVYDRLPRGTWVIAHDTTWWQHRDRLKDYLSFVRDPKYFSESIAFDIDNRGLELTVK
jgi:predicted O-methyltransferase YrrM